MTTWATNPSMEPLRQAAKIADETLHLVGDKAVGPDWYAKRSLIGLAYTSTELFMTGDTSKGCVETRNFLNRRISQLHDVRNLSGYWSSINSMTGKIIKGALNAWKR